MKLYSFILLIFLLGFQNAFAQNNFSGKVLDVITGKPLASATIIVGDKKITTNSLGEFLLSISNNDKITISYIGYETFISSVDLNKKSNTFYLTPISLSLADVEVTNTSNPNKSILYQPGSIAKIGSMELNRNTGLNLDDAIQTNVTGVQMNRRSAGGGQQLNIRGYGNGTRGTRGISSNFDGQGYKVYLNGIPLTDAEGITTMDDIDFSSIGNVEVVKGPAGTLYGLAIAGAINLTSEKAEKGKTSMSQQILMGEYGTRRFTTTLKAGTEKSSLLVNYGNQQTDGYTIHNASKKDFVNVIADVQPNQKNSFSMYVGYSNSYDQRSGELTTTQYDNNDFSGNPDYIKRDGHSNVVSFKTGISHIYTHSQNLSISSTVYGIGFNSNASSAAGWTDKNAMNYGLRSAINTKIPITSDITLGGVTGIEVQQQVAQVVGYSMKQSPYDSAATWVYGVNPYWVINTATSNIYATSTNHHLFSEWTLSLPNDFSILGGIGVSNMHLNLNDRFNTALITRPATFDTAYKGMVAPHFAINKVINKQVSIYASYSTGFKAPTSSYFYITTPAVTKPVTPATGSLNHVLSPEQGDQFELGSKGQLFDNKLTYELAYFNTVFSKKMTAIAVVSPASPSTTLYSYVVNGGKEVHSGVEALIKYNLYQSASNFISSIRPFANLTYSNFTYGDNFKIQKSVVLTEDYSNKMVAGVPKYMINFGVDVLSNVGLYGNMTYNYKDRTPITSMNDFYATSYSLVNGKIGYQNKLSNKINFDVYVGVTNLMGIKYPMMIFANQMPDVYTAAPEKPLVFGGVNLKYNF
jgi:iron complex outermembrane receptor protein